MVDTGYQTQTNVIFPLGVTDKVEKNLEAAINPARLAIKGTTDYDAKPADCLKPPFGWTGYEDTSGKYQPLNFSTVYAVGAVAHICKCPGKPVFMPSGLALGFKAEENDLLVPWGTAGQVAPAVQMGGKIGIKVPFSQNATVKDTGIDIPGGVLISDVIVDVVANVAGSTIDVGFINAVESGDEDGLLDGESCVASGLQAHVLSDATAGNITIGALLRTVIAEANGASATNVAMLKKYKTDGTIKSLVYTTSAHAISGFFYVFIESPGIVPVGKTAYTVDATSAAKDITVNSSL